MSDRLLNRLELERRARQRLAEFVPEALERLEEIAASGDGPSSREARKLLRQYQPRSRRCAARAPHHSHS